MEHYDNKTHMILDPKPAATEATLRTGLTTVNKR